MKHPDKWISLTCPECSRGFEVLKCTAHYRKYCSKTCHGKATCKKDSIRKIQTRDKRGIANPNWRGDEHKTFECIWCGVEYALPSWKAKERSGKFCSQKCCRAYTIAHKIPDHQQRLHRAMRRAVLRCLNGKKGNRKWESIIGYSREKLKLHLEKLFKEGMTWENYGQWHIDHINPMSAHKFSTEHDEGFRRCWALSNLQPLWAKENMSKGGINRWGGF